MRYGSDGSRKNTAEAGSAARERNALARESRRREPEERDLRPHIESNP